MRREATTNRPSWNGRSRGEVGRGQERERERNEAARVRGGVDAKYRQGCQVAETAAAPLSTGTSWFSPAGCRRGRQGMNRTTWRSGAGSRQGRVIDRGWKGWRRDAPSDVIACSNPPSDYPQAPSRLPPLGRAATYCPVCCLALIPNLPYACYLLSLRRYSASKCFFFFRQTPLSFRVRPLQRAF